MRVGRRIWIIHLRSLKIANSGAIPEPPPRGVSSDTPSFLYGAGFGLLRLFIDLPQPARSPRRTAHVHFPSARRGRKDKGTVNAKKRTNVLRVYTSILFFVHFVCGFTAWMFFCLNIIRQGDGSFALTSYSMRCIIPAIRNPSLSAPHAKTKEPSLCLRFFLEFFAGTVSGASDCGCAAPPSNLCDVKMIECHQVPPSIRRSIAAALFGWVRISSIRE